MHSAMLFHLQTWIIAFSIPWSAASPAPSLARSVDARDSPTCHYIPGDADWPSAQEWSAFNKTVGGRLIRGSPLAQSCYNPDLNSTECAAVTRDWISVTPYINDPVNVMSPYWQNDSCSPFPPHVHADGAGSCTLGNLAQYAIDVSQPADVIAGIQFVQAKNIRLTVKNTGHDYLGRSTGKGSLALWMHNLNDITFMQYHSANYTGHAVRMGAGAQSMEVTEAASKQGLVVVGGSCPTVGLAGGWVQGAGHGPLTAAYGLGADNALEYEVVTAAGQVVTATPSNAYADLFWALSGGGSGNYGVVLSATLKAYADQPVAGAAFSFANTHPDTFWPAVTKWLQHLLVLNRIPGLKTIGSIDELGFALDFATWPGATAAQLRTALAPFWADLAALNISLLTNVTDVHPTYLQHFNAFTTAAYTVNETAGSRLIPHAVVQDPARLDTLVAMIRNMTAAGGIFNAIASNLSHPNPHTAVLPAWRKSLFHLNFGVSLPENASWPEIAAAQTLVTGWQSAFARFTPASGTYINEAVVTDPTWKQDYFGANYPRLLQIKTKYDPNAVFWEHVAVGSDLSWTPAEDGRLCRVQSGYGE